LYKKVGILKKLLSEYPELLSEWHPTKNGDLSPEQFTFGSNKKVWWVCPKGHDYDVEIKSRTSKRQGNCPYCSGRRVGNDNNLEFLFPKIAAEWHPTKNGDLRPEEFTAGSGKKIWWICSKGHEYDAVIHKRTSNPLRNCPYCSGSRIGNDNNLKHLFPKISSEWHPTKNGDLKPEEFASRSGKKVWWLCPNKHSYDAKISDRTHKVSPKNCLVCNSLKYLFPDIVAEWHPTKNGGLKPDEVTYGSGKKVWWLCPKGHEYDTVIVSRTSSNTGCPYCSGREATEENNLKHLFPEVAAEWHPTKNGDLKPEDFKSGSNKKVWWICPKGHDYDSSINSRTGKNPSGCRYCSHQTSAPELRILAELRFVFNDVKTRYKIDGVEIDVYVPKLNLAIEYDGSYFHQGKEQKDLEKNEFLQLRKIKVIRVRHKPLKRITKNDLIVEKNTLSKLDLNRIFKKIYKFCDNESRKRIQKYFDSEDFFNEYLFREYLSYFPSPLPEKSLATNFPNLISEWDFEKNFPLTPHNFTTRTSKKIWWLCPKGHSYNTVINSRTGKNPTGCPFCSGREATEENNLKILFPKVADEWHPTKNGNLKPHDFTPKSSSKKVWWLCQKGHSYDATIAHRTDKNATGCPYCSGRRVSKDNNLKYLFPKIAAEWHPTKNGKLKPEEFTRGSHNKVWWLCPKGHEYDTVIASKTSRNGSGCPYCSGQRVCDDNNLKVLFPEIAAEWHPSKNGDLKPEDFTPGSSRKKVWWLCKKGHSYDNIIVSRTRDNPRGCPYCSGRRVSKENNLKFLYPKVAAEWHPTKNGDSRPEEFTCGNHKKVWWVCPEGHDYDAVIYSRTTNKPNGCPYCSGKRACEDNNLKLLYPKVAAEWHPKKNGDLKPEKFTCGSGKIIWWICSKGHSYNASINNRTSKGKRGCPYCSGRKVSDHNNLQFLFPKVATEWHPTKNGDSKPEKFASRSHKKVWWLCHKGHDYDAVIANRTSKRPTGCPHCYRNSS